MRIPHVLVVALLTVGLLGGCSSASMAAALTAQAGSDTEAADAEARADLSNATVAAVTFLIANPNATTMTVADLALPPAESAVALHFTSEELFCFDTTSQSGTLFKTPVTAIIEGTVEGACVEGVDY